jgi:hypothetical protein
MQDEKRYALERVRAHAKQLEVVDRAIIRLAHRDQALNGGS